MSLQPLRNVERSDVPNTIDLRSWRVVARDGTPLGTVAEVIVDDDDARPVYLNVLPHGQPDDATSECWVRVPYRRARTDGSSRCVILNDAAMLGMGTTTPGLIDRG